MNFFAGWLQWVAVYVELALVFVWCGERQGAVDFCFSGDFFWYWGFHLGFCFGWGTGLWAIVLWDLDDFLIFPNFLRSQVLSCSAACEATPIYHIYK